MNLKKNVQIIIEQGHQRFPHDSNFDERNIMSNFTTALAWDFN